MLFFKPTLKSFLRGRESQEKERERNLQVEMGGKMCQKDQESERKRDGGERASGRDPSVEKHQEAPAGDGGRERRGRESGPREPARPTEAQGKFEPGEDPYPHLQGHPHPHVSSSSLSSHHGPSRAVGGGPHLGVRQTFSGVLEPAGAGCCELAGGNGETFGNFAGQLLVT